MPDHPHRVVCLLPSVTDTVFALGSGDDVVAVSDYTTYPPAALKKPSIGSLVKPSIETILSFHPDLVLGTEIPGSAETATQLEAVGIPVYLVDPRGLAGILHSVASIGKRSIAGSRRLLSTPAWKGVSKPSERAPQVNRLRGSWFPVWYDPIITIGKHAFITEIIEAAGAKSVTDDLIPDWPQISLEAVITRAPDSLLLIRGGKIDIEYVAEAARLEHPSGDSDRQGLLRRQRHTGSKSSRHRRIGGIG